MTGVVAWTAFVLALLELLLLVAVVVVGRRFWRQVAPQVTPLLAMFTAPAAAASSSGPATVTGPEPVHSPPPGP